MDGTGLPKAFCEGQAVSRLGDWLSASQAFCVLSFHLPSAANIKNQFKKEKEKKYLIQQKKKNLYYILKVMLMTFKAQCNMTFIFILTLRKCQFSVYKAELFFIFVQVWVVFFNVTFVFICKGQASGLKVVIVKIIYENFSFFVIGNWLKTPTDICGFSCRCSFVLMTLWFLSEFFC